jgi:NADPH:quinone reductase-like Zn-dependent oxidoreductase
MMKWQGDNVFYSGSPIRNAEFQLVDARSMAKKSQSLDFVEAAAMPLTYITAYEALVERMETKRGSRRLC